MCGAPSWPQAAQCRAGEGAGGVSLPMNDTATLWSLLKGQIVGSRVSPPDQLVHWVPLELDLISLDPERQGQWAVT